MHVNDTTVQTVGRNEVIGWLQ